MMAISTSVVPGLQQRIATTNDRCDAVHSNPGANYWPGRHSLRLQHRLNCSHQHTDQERQLVCSQYTAKAN